MNSYFNDNLGFITYFHEITGFPTFGWLFLMNKNLKHYILTHNIKNNIKKYKKYYYWEVNIWQIFWIWKLMTCKTGILQVIQEKIWKNTFNQNSNVLAGWFNLLKKSAEIKIIKYWSLTKYIINLHADCFN